MHRKTISLMLMLLLAPTALAGSQADPEIQDGAGDQTETEPGALDGTLGADHEFPDVDILNVWIDQNDLSSFNIHVETSAEIKDNTQFAVAFEVAAGPTSVFNSTASGQEVVIESTGTSITAGPATMTKSGTIVTYTVAYADAGASGGDVIDQLTVSASRKEAAPATTTCPSGCVEQTGTDVAPDTGVGRPYTLDRVPVVGGATLETTGGQITHVVFAANGTANGTVTEDFVGISTTTMDVNASLVYNLVLTNIGTDIDTFNVTMPAPGPLAAANITHDFATFNVTLDPGATHSFNLVLLMSNTPRAQQGFQLAVDSLNGAATIGVGLIDVQDLPAPPVVTPPTTGGNETTDLNGTARDPVLGKGTFLQDTAEAMGFDKAFDDWAEVVLLALVLVLIILLVFLIMALAGSGWIKVTVTPKKITAEPGETAEFRIEVRNKKRRFHDALAYFDGDSQWRTGVLLKPDQGAAMAPLTRPGDERPVSLGAKEEPGDHMAGTLRIQVPEDAGDGETDHVTLNLVPTEDGIPLNRKAGRARVKVRAANAGVAPRTRSSGSVPVRLSSVVHEPAEPVAGDEVVTRATVENDSESETLRLRLVLELDGQEAEEETVEVPPRSARAVLFPWLAEDGNNRVRVQVYLA